MILGMYVIYDLANEESGMIQLLKNDKVAARWFFERIRRDDIVAPTEELELRQVGSFDSETSQIVIPGDEESETQVLSYPHKVNLPIGVKQE